jgi:hypothetical protein
MLSSTAPQIHFIAHRRKSRVDFLGRLLEDTFILVHLFINFRDFDSFQLVRGCTFDTIQSAKMRRHLIHTITTLSMFGDGRS